MRSRGGSNLAVLPRKNDEVPRSLGMAKLGRHGRAGDCSSGQSGYGRRLLSAAHDALQFLSPLTPLVWGVRMSQAARKTLWI